MAKSRLRLIHAILILLPAIAALMGCVDGANPYRTTSGAEVFVSADQDSVVSGGVFACSVSVLFPATFVNLNFFALNERGNRLLDTILDPEHLPSGMVVRRLTLQEPGSYRLCVSGALFSNEFRSDTAFLQVHSKQPAPIDGKPGPATPENRAPFLSVPLPELIVMTADTLVHHHISAIDPDGDSVAMTVTFSPASPAFKSTIDRGLLTLKALSLREQSTFNGSFVLSDGRTQTTYPMKVLVTPAGPKVDSPRFSGTIRVKPRLIALTDTLDITLTTDSPQTGEFTFGAHIPGRGKWLMRDSRSNRLIWLPALEDTGRASIVFTVSNVRGETDTMISSVEIVAPTVYGSAGFAIPVAGIAEDVPNYYFEIELSTPALSAGSVRIEIDRPGTTASPLDFSFTDTVVAFLRGDQSIPLTLTVLDDTIPENGEWISVRITHVTGMVIDADRSRHVCHIADNDDPRREPKPIEISFKEQGLAVHETDTVISVEIVLSDPSEGAVKVRLAFSGSAVVDQDYSVLNSSITFHPGQTRKKLRIRIFDDGMCERSEPVGITIESAVGARIGSNQRFQAVILSSDSFECKD